VDPVGHLDPGRHQDSPDGFLSSPLLPSSRHQPLTVEFADAEARLEAEPSPCFPVHRSGGSYEEDAEAAKSAAKRLETALSSTVAIGLPADGTDGKGRNKKTAISRGFLKVVPVEGLEPPPDFNWPKTALLLAFRL
jgi:hypothetical protein